MNKISYQEIDIKINIIFLERQVRSSTAHLDAELQRHLNRTFPETQEPMRVEEIESAINNAHIRITTSVDMSKDEFEIRCIISKKIRERLPMGIAMIEVLSLREEAEIYGNV